MGPLGDVRVTKDHLVARGLAHPRSGNRIPCHLATVRSTGEFPGGPSGDPVGLEMHRNLTVLSEKEQMAKLFPTPAGSPWHRSWVCTGAISTSGLFCERQPCAACPGPPLSVLCPRLLPSQRGAPGTKARVGARSDPVCKANCGVVWERWSETGERTGRKRFKNHWERRDPVPSKS